VTLPFSRVWPGDPYPLGATWDGAGVNFALFSENAKAVELCLFDPGGQHEVQRIPMAEQSDLVWHCYLPEARPGLLYGYRVHGPYAPHQGHRFNPKKLLLDPYARDIQGRLRWSDRLFGYQVGHPDADLSLDGRDSARDMPKCRVIDPSFAWGEDRAPRTPWHETVIYELHVKGFTVRHPEVPERLRGTYAGLAAPPVIDYLKHLGVTAVELMPMHAFSDDRQLLERGLGNYWGYNSIGYFAPDRRYSATGQIAEFKRMVKALHRAGIEVILDVVYNHTAEGSQLGPTLCFRGIDNSAYYRLEAEDQRWYRDYTGCGNTLNMCHPRVLQLIMDSLRYWVLEMHVDGFRFDLAAALARELHEVDRLGAFFDVIHQDPVLSRAKLIAEPWDLGEGGYQVGNFPPGWAEWNGRYRDTVRDYWRGMPGQLGDLATRLTGSSDLYEADGRRPVASINFVTAHDGFTLRDLVSYQAKHNQSNGEQNRDGEEHNRSCNHGVEGLTQDPQINALRLRHSRSLLATLLLSQGVPMLLAGDELGRTQGGNNNAYCQDNEVSWLDWRPALGPKGLSGLVRRLMGSAPGQLWATESTALLGFVRRLIRLRMAHPILRRRRFFRGHPVKGGPMKDILWLTPEGREMSQADWQDPKTRVLGVVLCGDGLDETDRQGRRLVDDDFLLLLNASPAPVTFRVPALPGPPHWEALLDTARQGEAKGKGWAKAEQTYEVMNLALVLLRRRRWQKG
jgi:isoamylase